MNNRKKAPIGGLFYREIYPMCKELILCYVIAIALGIIFYLIKLSMEIGNLADMSGENLKMLETMLPGYAIYLPSVLFMAQVNGSISSFQFEMGKNWRCYIASIPVSEWKYVGIKFMISFGVLLTGMIFALINAAVMCSVYDVKFDKSVAANLLLCAALVSLMCAVLYILNFLFRNANIAIITGFVLIYVTMMFFMFDNLAFIEEISEDETEGMMIILEKINDFSTSFMPFSVPFIIGVLLLSWVLCSLLAKRREK